MRGGDVVSCLRLRVQGTKGTLNHSSTQISSGGDPWNHFPVQKKCGILHFSRVERANGVEKGLASGKLNTGRDISRTGHQLCSHSSCSFSAKGVQRRRRLAPCSAYNLLSAAVKPMVMTTERIENQPGVCCAKNYSEIDNLTDGMMKKSR